eukprot:5846318-Pyramimonas_sp.AAC.2
MLALAIWDRLINFKLLTLGPPRETKFGQAASVSLQKAPLGGTGIGPHTLTQKEPSSHKEAPRPGKPHLDERAPEPDQRIFETVSSIRPGGERGNPGGNPHPKVKNRAGDREVAPLGDASLQAQA